MFETNELYKCPYCGYLMTVEIRIRLCDECPRCYTARYFIEHLHKLAVANDAKSSAAQLISLVS